MKFHLNLPICVFLVLLGTVVPMYVYAESPHDINSSITRTLVPGSTIRSGIMNLPTDFLDPTKWPRIACVSEPGEEQSRLVSTGIDATPTAFDDWLAGPAMRLDSLDDDANPARKGKLNSMGLFDKKKTDPNNSGKCKDCEK